MDETDREDPKFFTVKEVARIWGVGKQAVYKAIWGGKLSAFRIGRQLRVTTAALNAYAETHPFEGRMNLGPGSAKRAKRAKRASSAAS